MLLVGIRRVSGEDQQRKGYSLPEQLQANLKKAGALIGAPLEGIRLVDGMVASDEELAEAVARAEMEHVMIDFGEQAPGDLAEKPGQMKALALCRRHRPQYVICLHPDRFARSLMIQLVMYDEFRRTGAEVHFAEVQFEDSPEGRLFFQMMGAISEYSKARMLATFARGRRGKLRQKRLPHGVRIYGFIFDKEKDLPVPAPEQAAVVRELFRWVAEERLGAYLCARRLNGELPGYAPVPAPRGNWWYKGTVQRLLRNPAYMGLLVVNKSDQTGMAKNRFVAPAARARKRARPQDEWVVIPVEPIVPADVWHRAQAVLADARRLRPGAPTSPYLLSGLCVCGICGAPCTGAKNGKNLRYYMCTRKVRSNRYERPDRPSIRCALPMQRAEQVDELVWAQVLEWYRNPAARAEARRQELADRQAGPHPDALERVRAEREKLQAEAGELRRLIQKGLVEDRDAAEAELADLVRRLDLHRRREAELQLLTLTAAPAPLDAAAHDTEIAADVEAMAGAGFAERQQLIRFVARQVVLYPDKPPQVLPR